MFILHLKEEKCLSQSAVNEVVSATQSLFKHTQGRLRAGVMECLSRNGTTDLPDLKDYFEKVKDPFEGLNTTFLQEKVCGYMQWSAT